MKFFKGNRTKNKDRTAKTYMWWRMLFLTFIITHSSILSLPFGEGWGGVANAQTIFLKLSAHPNKQVTLLATQGIRKDTLQKIVLDGSGKGVFNLKDIKNQAGLVTLTLKTSSLPDATFDWVYSPIENITIVGDGEYVHTQNTKILNSVENTTLNRWFASRHILKQKLGLGQELAQFYQPNELPHQQLKTEQKNIEKSLAMLNDSIKTAHSFAGRYLQFVQDSEQILPNIYKSDSTRTVARKYFQYLDFEGLHTTGQWFGIINGLTEAYAKNRIYYQKFGIDVVANLKRIKSLTVYTDLADAAISICQSYGWEYDADHIINFLVADNRLQNTSTLSPKLKKIWTSQSLQAGKKAPDLLITKHIDTEKGHQHEVEILPTDQLLTSSEKYTLLVFHESGCGGCERTLAEITNKYVEFQKQGIKIMSFSSDQDESIFKQTAAKLPWAEKHCDLQGFKGSNFKNYAIIGTPTLFLLDRNGKIVAKTALLNEVIDSIKKP